MLPPLRHCSFPAARLLRLSPLLFALLGTSPSPAAEEKPARVDAVGDPLPSGAVARLGTLRLRHQGWILAADFSPDGKVVASVGDFGVPVRLWDTASGKEIRQITAPRDVIGTVKFSPTGRILAGATSDEDHALYLWDATTGKLLHRLQASGEGAVLDMAFADGGKSLLCVDTAGLVRWWSVADGRKLRVWEVKQSIEKPPGAWRFEGLESATLAPDGRLLAAIVRWAKGDDKQSQRALWDTGSGKLRWQLERNQDNTSDLGLSADGKVVAMGVGDADISLRDGASGRELRRIRARKEDTGIDSFWEGLALSPDGKLLASIKPGRAGVRIWDTGSGKVVHDIGRPSAFDPESPLGRPLFSPDGKRLLFPCGVTVVLWDVASWTERPRLPGHRGEVHFLAFSADGKTLLSGSPSSKPQWPCPRESITWDTATWREVNRSGSVSLPGLVSRSHDHRLGIVYDRGDFFLTELPGGKGVRKLDVHSDRFYADAAFFSPSGRTVAVVIGRSEKTKLALVDVATGKHWGSLPEKPRIDCLAFAPDDRTLVWTDSEAILHVTAVDGARELRRLSKRCRPWSQRRGEPALAFSPAGPQLAFWDGESGAVVFWDWQTGRELGRLESDGPRAGSDDDFLEGLPLYSLAYSPDGRMLAVGSRRRSHEVELWEVASGQLRRRIGSQLRPALTLAFSPDGRLLASGSDDTTILVWDLYGTPVRDKPPQREALWADLADADAGRAYRAMTELIRQPSTAVALLGRKLQPASPAGADKIARWITDLDHDDFDQRERATRELEGLGELAEPALRRALREDTPTEVRRRIGLLLDRLRRPSRASLRTVRAVEVLEQLRTEDARHLLERLAKGAPDARLTREARASLVRLQGRPAGKPASR